MSDVSKVDPMTCELKVGDRVEVVGQTIKGQKRHMGTYCYVREITHDGGYVVWPHKAMMKYTFPRSSLRWLPPEPAKVAPAPEPQPAPNSLETPDSSPSATGEEWAYSEVEITSGGKNVGYGETEYEAHEITKSHNASLARLAAAHRAEVERVRAEERERCAKLVDTAAIDWRGNSWSETPQSHVLAEAAAAIRDMK